MLRLKKIILLFLITSFIIFLLFQLRKKVDPNFPNQNFNLIVGFQKNGGSDRSARFLKEIMKDDITLNIKNIPGDSGMLGLNEFKNSKDKVYTLGMINYPSFYYTESLKKYNINKKDFNIIFSYIYDVGVLIVGNHSKIKDFNDFKKASKNKEFTIGENGIGASDYIAAKLLVENLNVQPKLISFSSSSQILEAVKNGYIDSAILKESEVVEAIQNKNIRGILAFSDEKLKFLKNVPLSSEENINLNLGSIRAIAVSKNTPKYIEDYLKHLFPAKLDISATKKIALEKRIPFKFQDQKTTLKFIKNREVEVSNLYK